MNTPSIARTSARTRAMRRLGDSLTRAQLAFCVARVASIMQVDAMMFRAFAKPIFPHRSTLAPDEAAAVVQLAFLASGADLDEDMDETSLRAQLSAHVCGLAGISPKSVARPSPLPLPIDEEARVAWLERICPRLRTTSARELAYVVAYLVAIGDLEIAPIESIFIAELQRQLGVEDTRASELVAHACEVVTPMPTSDKASTARTSRG